MELHYSPEYVLDHMQMYEILIALKYRHYGYKENWEQTRLIAYMLAQCNSKKRLKLEDIIKFPWDDEMNDDEDVKPITKEDAERISKKAQELINKGLV